MSVVLVVRLRVQEGTEDEARAVLSELAAETRNEPGCVAYVPCVERDDPRAMLIFEEYVDQAALEAHAASEHFRRLAAGRLWDLLESPRERVFYEPIA
jgi:quinol monooxygenase YgiN